MAEFFERNMAFLIIVSIIGTFVLWSLYKDRKAEKKMQEKNMQKKTEEIQKDNIVNLQGDQAPKSGKQVQDNKEKGMK